MQENWTKSAVFMQILCCFSIFGGVKLEWLQYNFETVLQLL